MPPKEADWMPQSLPWIPFRKALWRRMIRESCHSSCGSSAVEAFMDAAHRVGDRQHPCLSPPRGGSLAHRAVPLWGGSGVFYPALGVPEHIALDPVAVQKGVEPFSPNRVIALLQARECSMGLNALLSPPLE